MAKLTLEIDLDNDCFSAANTDNFAEAVRDVLTDLADRIGEQTRAYLAGNGSRMRVADVNGNTIGFANFIDLEAIDRDDVESFVNQMETDDLRRSMDLLDLQVYEYETRETWVDALVEAIINEDVTMEQIKERFGY
jgi:cell division ATPase FtsA